MVCFADAIYFSLLVLTNGDIDSEILPKTHAFRAIYFLMILLGLVLFAILIGFISDIVRTYMNSLNEGATKVIEQNHTLILGFNEATPRVIVQCAFLRKQYQVFNEQRNPILKIFPFLHVLLRYFGIFMEKASSSVAEKDIVVLENKKTKDEMHAILLARYMIYFA